MQVCPFFSEVQQRIPMQRTPMPRSPIYFNTNQTLLRHPHVHSAGTSKGNSRFSGVDRQYRITPPHVLPHPAHRGLAPPGRVLREPTTCPTPGESRGGGGGHYLAYPLLRDRRHPRARPMIPRTRTGALSFACGRLSGVKHSSIPCPRFEYISTTPPTHDLLVLDPPCHTSTS